MHHFISVSCLLQPQTRMYTRYAIGVWLATNHYATASQSQPLCGMASTPELAVVITQVWCVDPSLCSCSCIIHLFAAPSVAMQFALLVKSLMHRTPISANHARLTASRRGLATPAAAPVLLPKLLLQIAKHVVRGDARGGGGGAPGGRRWGAVNANS